MIKMHEPASQTDTSHGGLGGLAAHMISPEFVQICGSQADRVGDSPSRYGNAGQLRQNSQKPLKREVLSSQKLTPAGTATLQHANQTGRHITHVDHLEGTFHHGR